MRVHCEQCGKYLLDSYTESKGATAARVQSAGFVSKMPILFGVTDGFHFFCSKECWNEWFKVHCKHTKEGDEVLARMREEMPKAIENCAKGVQRLIKAFEKSRNLRTKNNKK